MKKVILFLTIKLWAINILILNSYSPILTWTRVQNNTLIEILQKNITNLDLSSEFMDTKKFRPTPQLFERYKNYLEEKYKEPFDIVVVTDDNALNFIKKYKEIKLFKNSKIFFEGINNLSLKDKLNRNSYTGVFEKKNPLSNFKIAKKIKPHLKTIYVISDNSVSGNKTLRQYQQVFNNIKEIKFVYINKKNIEDVIKRLKNYDKNSVMMLLTFASVFKNGHFINPEKVPILLSKIYHNPMIVHNDIYTNIENTNIIGGDVTDAKQQATLNAHKVLQFLNGTPIYKIPMEMDKANRIYLNVKHLNKFGIDVDNLNIPEAILINKPTSFYQIYKTEILTFIIIFILIILFLILLAKKNREIHKLNKSLEKKIKKAIYENSKKEQIIFQQSKLAAMGEMIGAIAHQWRQPLNSLALHIQLLVDDFFDNRVDEKYIIEFEHKNLNIINFMSKTIDDFREFFVKDKEKTKFSLLESILDVLKLIDKQLKDHNIKIIIDGDDSKIIGYQNEFKQVVLNLINNAKDAIIMNNIKNGYISIIVHENQIMIEDNGGGIPENIKNRIFEPYFSTKGAKGTGIGLYMSKIIVEEHLNGTLSFTSNNNKTKFIIDFNSN